MKSASIKSYGSARERLSASTSSSTTSTGRAKPPPPPPPPTRRAPPSSTSSQRSNSVRQVPATPGGITDVDKIDWANLSAVDKQAFFAWLDEFFARYLDGTPPSNAPSPRPSPSLPPRRFSSRASQNTPVVSDPQDKVAPAPAAAPVTGRRNLPPSLSQQGPVRPPHLSTSVMKTFAEIGGEQPKIKLSTKPPTGTGIPAPPLPSATTGLSHPADPSAFSFFYTIQPRSSFPMSHNPVASADLQMSFPPPTTNGSAAADLAVFMHPSTPWDSDWYASGSPIPPHLNGSPDIRFSGSFGHSDPRTKTASGVILFSDLSICWYSVTYGSGPVARWARFRPRPEPLDGSVLQQAAETCGAAVAAFAERALASGRPVGRGECWDVAHEALLHTESLFGPRDAPILSTARAHGHLLFCGKPGVGRWRGGDDRFRAGDVVEWRSVRIGMGYGAFAFLGEPDHTAVLVEDTVPRRAVADGQSVKPADVGVLTVVEQTAGRAPKRESYDLANLQQGEVWVYRPVGMATYLGSTLSIDIPSGLETFAV